MRLKPFSHQGRRLGPRDLLLWLVLLGLGLGGLTAFASSVRLAWDPTTESGVQGYRVYRGSSPGNPDWMLDVGLTTQAEISDLVPGTTVYFVVTAYNAQRVETAPSNEVTYQVPASIGLPPLATSAALTVSEDASLALVLTGVSQSGSALTYEIVTPPTKGTLSGTPPNLTYRPFPDYFGTDAFTFRTRDAVNASLPATVILTVAPANDAPVALSQVVDLTTVDSNVVLLLDGFDIDGDPISFLIRTPPAHGQLSGFLPELSYTPDPGYSGTDFLTFVATDGLRESAPARLDFRISATGSALVANPATFSLLEDSSVSMVLTGSGPAGQALTYAVVLPPQKGVLTGTPPNLVYRPDPDLNGPDGFEFTVSDGVAVSAPALVTLNIGRVNDVPTVYNKSITVSEDGLANLFLSGADVDGDTLVYRIVAQPTLGVLSGTPPSLTYRPNANSVGTDTFSYTASDGTVTSAIATFTVSISPVNDAPVATPQSVSLALNTFTNLTLAGRDLDGDPLSFVIAQAPANGVLSGTPPSVRYTPRSGFVGTDAFAFTVSDGSLVSAPATVALTVTGVVGTPTANSLSLVTAEDTSLAVRLSGTDPQGDPLSYQIVSSPTSGRLTGAGADWIYQPPTNFFGTDSFTYTVTDGTTVSAVATVAINVTAVNDAPKAIVKTLNLSEDSVVNLFLGGLDADGDALTFAVVSGPSLGTLSGTPPSLVYRPLPNVTGTDVFTYSASDGRLSATATFTLTIVPANDAPIALGQSATAVGGSFVNLVLAGSDPDGDPLTFTVTQSPLNGSLSGTAPNLRYTPRAGYSGPDSFSFAVSDGQLVSGSATVVMTVTPPLNAVPSAQGSSLVVAEDGSLAVRLSGTDADGGPLTYRVMTNPARGTLTGVAPNLTYVPQPNYFGTDSFTFTVSDGTNTSSVATVGLTITPVNDAPVASSKSLSVVANTSVNFTIGAADVEGDPLTFTVTSGPLNGTLTGVAPSLRYTPRAGYVGADSFSFVASDGTVASAPAVVTFSVTAPLGTPVANPLTITLNEDSSAAITLAGTDPDGGTLSYLVTQAPTKGTLTGTAPNLVYRPAANYAGPDSFLYTVSDGTLTSAPALASITVNPANDAPTAVNKNLTIVEDKTVNLFLGGSDVDGDSLTFTVVRPPANGTLSGTPPALLYRPNPNYYGPDSFTYTSSDGIATSAVATFSLNVTPVNDVPVASGQSLSTPKNEWIDLRLLVSDPDGDLLTYTLIQGPTNGVLTGLPPDVRYLPALNFVGADAIRFQASDGVASSAIATISIQVTPTNHVPVAEDLELDLGSNQSIAVTLKGTDLDGDALDFQILNGPDHGVLTGTAPDLLYRPTPNYDGADQFTYTVSDGSQVSLVAVVAITVTPTNNAPTALSSEVSLTEDTSVTLRLNGTDPDGDPLSYLIVQSPAKGSIQGTPPNLTYRPSNNYAGTDLLKFCVTDGSRTSAVATVTLVVEPVNDAPRAITKTVTVTEDAVANLFPGGADPDGDVLTFVIVRPPANGTLTPGVSSFLYRPNPNFNGPDSFAYTASDGITTSAAATFTINVEGVNDAPVALAQTVSLVRGTSAPVLLSGLDIEGSDLVFSVVEAPTNGVLSGVAPNLTYTSTNLTATTDSFRFTVHDGELASVAATVTLSLASPASSQLASVRGKDSRTGRIVGLHVTGSEVILEIEVRAGTIYQLEYRGDWPDPSGPWIPLQQLGSDRDGTLRMVDGNGAGDGQRFYRVRAILRDQ